MLKYTIIQLVIAEFNFTRVFEAVLSPGLALL
jgi:hypothetical protein